MIVSALAPFMGDVIEFISELLPMDLSTAIGAIFDVMFALALWRVVS